ncbi:MAG: EscU/YscU/HrcU family type III secretion system export apparatus switch protein, partial [Planctomycetes bacterium]|nr:EscU/YscU/HrcU family type III secretion system export apparatus switch protein [Planctomycetota bacterium]
MFKDDAGKTEKPTAGRLAEASNKGNVPLSREFTMAGTLLIAVFVLMGIGDWLMDVFAELLRFGLDVNLAKHLIEDSSIDSAMSEMKYALIAVAPPFLTLLAVFVVATAIAGYGQIGLKLRPEALSLKLERLNPVTNMTKLVSFSSIMRTLVSAAKLAALGSVLYFVLAAHMPQFTQMYENESFSDSVGIIVDTAFEILIWISVIVLLLSIGDI